MPLATSFKFNNGHTIPAVGLGTWVCIQNRFPIFAQLGSNLGLTFSAAITP